MVHDVGFCARGERKGKEEHLLELIKEVGAVLRAKRFSQHVIECAISALYRAALPYITGKKDCTIRHWRAWIFKVAVRAAIRAAGREVRCQSLEPAILATKVKAPKEGKELFDVASALDQLTEQQQAAVELCLFAEMRQCEAAKSMGIAPPTLSRHLKAAKRRLKLILSPYAPKAFLKNPA